MSDPSVVMMGRQLRKLFRRRSRRGAAVHAVDTVDIELRRGEVFGLLGESGSGKSTLAEIMAGLQWPTSGEMTVLGEPLFQGMPRTRWRDLRRKVQVVFQNPFESVNPRLRIHEIVAEPLEVAGVRGEEQRRRVQRALERVGLTPAGEFASRWPHELSGGQLQRACIARALTVEPAILIADEPVSMLDLSVRAGILRLLDELKRSHNMGILLISHDISTLVAVADRIGVMYLGEIVETGPTEQLLRAPSHPYFRALLAAVPTLAESLLEKQAGDTALTSSSTKRPPSGCRLAPRCPLADVACTSETQLLRAVEGAERHLVRCWRSAAPGA